MNRSRRAMTVAAGLAVSLGFGMVAATPAAAATCSPNDVCLWLYYNSESNGARLLVKSNISNLAGYTFSGPGAGAGTAVKNNAASATFRADNNFYASSGSIFFNSGYSGPCDQLMSMENGIKFSPRLVRTYNDNASVKIVSGLSGVGNHPTNCYEW
ncbi:peptidase M23 [Streptomyces uncialis]|uniref:peptidase M23 n=1 Tax=Streptomyces uncialis TaxID=1048205 RepID=UPI00380ACA69